MFYASCACQQGGTEPRGAEKDQGAEFLQSVATSESHHCDLIKINLFKKHHRLHFFLSNFQLILTVKHKSSLEISPSVTMSEVAVMRGCSSSSSTHGGDGEQVVVQLSSLRGQLQRPLQVAAPQTQVRDRVKVSCLQVGFLWRTWRERMGLGEQGEREKGGGGSTVPSAWNIWRRAALSEKRPRYMYSP